MGGKGPESTLEGCDFWGAANGGLRDGGLSKSEDMRKKVFFFRFLDFPGAQGEKAEKGRKRAISADFQEGRPDSP